MSDALGFVFSAANTFVAAHFFVPENIPLGPSLAQPETILTILTGDGSDLTDAGGSVPHVALWDDAGSRIGIFHPTDGDEADQAPQGGTAKIVVKQTRHADPAYVLLSQHTDGICIAAVQVSNGQATGTFYGDLAYVCGMPWYYSNRKLGDATPRCMWLDGDHSNGIKTKAMSFHLPDMVPLKGRLETLNSNRDFVCKSTPRFSDWENLVSEGTVPFFNPPLTYAEDGSDDDPERAVDTINFDKGVQFGQGETRRVKRFRDRRSANSTVTAGKGSNPDPKRLVVTDMDGHSAKELCEHPTSYGWDLVSMKEALFCDMVHKKLYALCGHEVKEGCFDEESKRVISAEKGFQATTEKSYSSISLWKS